ncbi:YbjN domain-containing protein [Deinococcus soli (ex Cha et al. 2016)]|uniref:Uncharacterized protein n=2 Tax=Deinococcus soli (ex Cha et al. 2016) TaxID=1309411 RepID=A0ACC6KPH5_9DEIO|nr:YbjN domain-containing protein [Deinococcus soli (ex Cha et al. 2016)]MDR6221393.1 hypothetical protein [Deinococcus soli (ex Cha et al. 2016)]MDR6331394.1 hypothetical protein [Deinococcus soli (ex Cha et al. 2016)]MDR6754552.1 hypothetical protein [Deinococcus soli (ex Cha et al. 2016)]
MKRGVTPERLVRGAAAWVLAALLTVPAAAASAQPGPNGGTDVQQVLRAAQGMGSATLKQSKDGPRITADAVLIGYTVIFSGCDAAGRFCTHMVLETLWRDLALEDAVRWNQEWSGGRAYMDGDLLVLDHWVSLGGGMSDQALTQLMDWWTYIMYEAQAQFYD